MDEDKIESFDIDDEEFQLDSIRAEIISEAYIDGDIRTPKEILDEQTRRIIEEVRQGIFSIDEDGDYDRYDEYVDDSEDAEPETAHVYVRTTAEPAQKAAAVQTPEPRRLRRADTDTRRFDTGRGAKKQADDDGFIEPAGDVFQRIDAQESGGVPTIESDAVDDADLEFINKYAYSEYTPDEEIQRAVAEAIAREADAEAEDTPRIINRALGAVASRRKPAEDPVEEFLEEPDYRERAKTFAKRCNSLAPRALAAGIIAAVMLIFTLIFEGGNPLPFGIGRSVLYAHGCMLIMQLVVMLLSVDLLTFGALRLIRGKPTLESLLLVSCAASLLDGGYIMLKLREGAELFGGTPLLPYSLIPVVAAAFALAGERMYLQGLTTTLRQAASGAKPQPARELRPIMSEYRLDLDRTVIKHAVSEPTGFYANLMQSDSCEQAYGWLAPAVIIFAGLVAALSAVLHPEEAAMFPRMFAGVLAGATVFQGAITFASPFVSAVKAARRRGVSIAGNGGANDLYYTDGVCVTDEDLYPPGTISIGKSRILDNVPPDKALAYTATLLATAGGGLGRVFTDHLTRRGLSMLQVQEFTYNEDGVTGYIQGDQVMVGSSAFMKLFRIRLPDGFEQTSAVYTAINGRLIAMFPVEYMPMAVVQRAITTIIRRGVHCYMTVRDFNLTPKMISRSFDVAEDALEYMSINNTNALEENSSNIRTSALMSRGGIDVYGETVAIGRRLKLVTLILTAVTVAAAVIGALLMTVLLWNCEWELARTGRLLLFLAVSAIISLVLTALGSMFRNLDF